MGNILKMLVDFYVPLGTIPDPFHEFIKWIRILPNDADPTWSGSTTLILKNKIFWRLVTYIRNCIFR